MAASNPWTKVIYASDTTKLTNSLSLCVCLSLSSSVYEHLASSWLFHPAHFSARLAEDKYVDRVEERSAAWTYFVQRVAPTVLSQWPRELRPRPPRMVQAKRKMRFNTMSSPCPRRLQPHTRGKVTINRSKAQEVHS